MKKQCFACYSLPVTNIHLAPTASCVNDNFEQWYYITADLEDYLGDLMIWFTGEPRSDATGTGEMRGRADPKDQ